MARYELAKSAAQDFENIFDFGKQHDGIDIYFDKYQTTIEPASFERLF